MRLMGSIISKNKHGIDPQALSKNALKVLTKLNQGGYEAYLVGGAIRDILLDKQPKDFDVATDAHPEEVKKLFRNCRLIGRRFRLAHILYGYDVIEVATFRGPHEGEKTHLADQDQSGRIIRDNVYGNIEEDAIRRDFTINALYYNIKDHSISDFAGGMKDIECKVIRMIGDVETRYREDPVRMLRAVRFAAKLDFTIEKQTSELIFELKDLLLNIPVARLFDECLKLFQGGYGLSCFRLLRQYQLFELLFPMTEAVMQTKPKKNKEKDKDKQQSHSTLLMIEQALKNTDARIAIGKSVNPAFLLSVFLWQTMQDHRQRFISQGMHEIEALISASREVLSRQQGHTSIPKRLSLMIKEIWHMQAQLQHPTRKRALRTLDHKRFRAAYDFLLLRQSSGEKELTQWCEWWTEIQLQPRVQQEFLCAQLSTGNNKSKRRRRRKKTNSSD